jgi:hypothetical protein
MIKQWNKISARDCIIKYPDLDMVIIVSLLQDSGISNALLDMFVRLLNLTAVLQISNAPALYLFIASFLKSLGSLTGEMLLNIDSTYQQT